MFGSRVNVRDTVKVGVRVVLMLASWLWLGSVSLSSYRFLYRFRVHCDTLADFLSNLHEWFHQRIQRDAVTQTHRLRTTLFFKTCCVQLYNKWKEETGSCEKCRHLERGTHVPDGGILQIEEVEMVWTCAKAG